MLSESSLHGWDIATFQCFFWRRSSSISGKFSDSVHEIVGEPSQPCARACQRPDELRTKPWASKKASRAEREGPRTKRDLSGTRPAALTRAWGHRLQHTPIPSMDESEAITIEFHCLVQSDSRKTMAPTKVSTSSRAEAQRGFAS